jgi:hypothetical protein
MVKNPLKPAAMFRRDRACPVFLRHLRLPAAHSVDVALINTPRSLPRNLSIWFRHPTDKSIKDYLLFANSGSMLSGNCDSIERFARRLLSLIALAPLLFGRLPRPVAFIAGGFLFGQ